MWIWQAWRRLIEVRETFLMMKGQESWSRNAAINEVVRQFPGGVRRAQ